MKNNTSEIEVATCDASAKTSNVSSKVAEVAAGVALFTVMMFSGPVEATEEKVQPNQPSGPYNPCAEVTVKNSGLEWKNFALETKAIIEEAEKTKDIKKLWDVEGASEVIERKEVPAGTPVEEPWKRVFRTERFNWKTGRFGEEYNVETDYVERKTGEVKYLGRGGLDKMVRGVNLGTSPEEFRAISDSLRRLREAYQSLGADKHEKRITEYLLHFENTKNRLLRENGMVEELSRGNTPLSPDEKKTRKLRLKSLEIIQTAKDKCDLEMLFELEEKIVKQLNPKKRLTS